MASFMAKVGRFLVWNVMNMNPETGKKNMVQVCSLISNTNTKTKKGYVLTKETTPDGVRFVRIKPTEGTSDKLVLYFHGGGYVAGLSQAYYLQACDYCKAVGPGVQAILLDYDLAPEFKYPVQHNQALSIWNYVQETEGYKPENIILGGDSAGGNLVCSMCLHLRDDKKPLPRALFLLSPWTDMVGVGQSYITNYNDDPLFGDKKNKLDEERIQRMLKSEMYVWCWEADRKDPYVSPVLGDYEGFPTTLFTVGGSEILLDDTYTIAKNMESHGITNKVISHEKMFHIYPLYSFFPESKDAYKQILEFIAEQMK